jgi:hypothetical protein
MWNSLSEKAKEVRVASSRWQLAEPLAHYFLHRFTSKVLHLNEFESPPSVFQGYKKKAEDASARAALAAAGH